MPLTKVVTPQKLFLFILFQASKYPEIFAVSIIFGSAGVCATIDEVVIDRHHRRFTVECVSQPSQKA